MTIKLNKQEIYLLNKEIPYSRHMHFKAMTYDYRIDRCTLHYQTPNRKEEASFEPSTIENIIGRSVRPTSSYEYHLLSEMGMNLYNPLAYAPMLEQYEASMKSVRKWDWEICMELDNNEYKELEVYMSNLLEDLSNY